jgi:ferredoxin
MSRLCATLEIRGELHEVSLEPGETIFAAAHRAGLTPPFSCIAGYCGACVATLQEGEVEMRENRALGPKQLARGLILTCQAVPKPGGCRVRFVEEPVP